MTEKKKILLVSNGFYPEISPRSFRATELAKEFFRQGHDVTVISKYRDHNYSAFLRDYQVKFKMWRKPIFPKIPSFRQKALKFVFSKVARILAIFIEYPGIEEMFLVKKILKVEKGYDMMVSFAVPYPVQWGVARARTSHHRISRIWIADCGDPYMGDTLDSFRKPFYFSFLEKFFCRKADFITIPVESAKPGYYPEFHGKIRIIPQGFDFKLENGEKKQHEHGYPEFAYAGKFLRGIRDPEKLLKYLTNTGNNFKFHIFTDQSELVDEYRDALGNRLIVSGYIPRNELMKVLSNMDFLINFDNNTSLNIPSKLIDYAISGRPVLNITRNFNPDEMGAFLKGDYSARIKLPPPEQYHIKNITRKFIDLLQKA